MEQNRVLIVLLTVVAVLGIVITLGAFGLNPFGERTNTGTRNSSIARENQGQENEDPQGEEALEDAQNGVDDTMERLQEGSEESIPLGENNPEEGEGQTGDASDAISLETEETEQYIPENAQPSRPQSTPASRITSSSSRTSSASSQTSSTTTAPSTNRTQTVTVQEYWIQVGAYSDRFQAQFIAERLEQEGLKGTLFTTSAGGQTLYRVRIGPYNTRSEAEKFLGWITPLDGFADSYVSRMTNTRQQ
jgi:cell division protein FtsN